MIDAYVFLSFLSMGNSDPRLLFFSALSAPKLGHVSMGRRDIFLSFRVILPLKQPNLSPFPKAVKDYVRCTVRNLYNSTQVGNDTLPTSDFFQKNPGLQGAPSPNPSRKNQVSDPNLSPNKKSQRNRALWGHRGSFHQWRLRIDSTGSRASYPKVLRVQVRSKWSNGAGIYLPIHLHRIYVKD